MRTSIARWALFASTVALTLQPALAKTVAKTVQATISAPIPSTPTSRPFLDAADRLAAVGYVQEEFILSGKANVYGWVGSSRQTKVVAGPADYATRVLVWRPNSPGKFSGNVEVTILNASSGYDQGKPTDFTLLAAQGDVWIGITTKAIAAKSLKQFDPARYARLRWDNPAPAAARCPYPSIIPVFMSGGQASAEASAKAGRAFSSPDTEDGLVWDMLGQLGELLKSDQRQKILPGFGKPRLYMTGISQSSLIVRTFAITFHDRYRSADRRPIYDGYLGVVGPSMLRISQCEEDVPLQDPRQKFTSLDVPFISLSSEGEMWQAMYTRQPDKATARGGWISYEVAGGSHGAGEIPGRREMAPIGTPPAPDVAKTGVQRPAINAAMLGNIMPPDAKPNNLPWAPIARGAYHNLQLWVLKGVIPPRAAPIAVDQNFKIVRDSEGNAIGGVRPTYIDVPTATHTGYLSAGGMGGTMGARKPFTTEALKLLYPEPAAYVAKFSAATDRLVAGRWISREDGEAMKKAAADMPMAN